MDQPGKVANPARGQLVRENEYFSVPCVPEKLVARDGFSRPVPRQPAHLHTRTESGAYLRGFLPNSAAAAIYETAIRHRLSPECIGSRNCVPRAFTAESPRAQGQYKSQASFERVLPWQVTMDQLIFASLSHTHYWYEVVIAYGKDRW